MTKKLSRLTDAFLASIAEPGPEREIAVPGRDGLYVRRLATGSITFRYRFTPQGTGKRCWHVIGTYGADGISIAEAYKRHDRAKSEVEQGLDPRVEEKRRVETARRTEERARDKGKLTIRRVIAEWAWHHARRRRKRPREAVKMLKANFKSWGGKGKGKPVTEFKKRDAVELCDKIVARGSPAAANRFCDLARQVFTLCVERDLLESNPFLGLRKPGGEEEERDRHLGSEEIRVTWKALSDPEIITPRLGLALKLLLVTGQRGQELRLARVEHFDLDNKLWLIPPESIKTVKPKRRAGKKRRTKSSQIRREHLVPLSDMACDLVRELLPYAGPTGRLLPNHRSKLKPDAPIDRKTLYKAMARHLKIAKDGTATLFGLEEFAPHDFRRTLSTGLTSQGIPLETVGKCINHREKRKKDATTTERVYDRYEYLKEKRAALDLWGTTITLILKGEDPLDTQTEAA